MGSQVAQWVKDKSWDLLTLNPDLPFAASYHFSAQFDDLEDRVLVMIWESYGSDSIIHVCISECIMCIFIHSLSEEIWRFVNKSDMPCLWEPRKRCGSIDVHPPDDRQGPWSMNSTVEFPTLEQGSWPLYLTLLGSWQWDTPQGGCSLPGISEQVGSCWLRAILSCRCSC